MTDFINELRTEFVKDPDGGFAGLTNDELATDELTGHFQRKYWLMECRHALARAKRANEKVAILFLDVNNLKKINDTKPWGSHDLGDTYIKAVSNVLNLSTREEDVIGRFGGDEFVIFLPNFTPKDSTEFENRIKSGLKKELDNSDRFAKVPSNVSMGVSLGFSYWDGEENLDSLISKADHMMYEDKRKSKEVEVPNTRPIKTYVAE